MKDNLIVPVSADPILGTPRRATLEYFQILPDLNMVFAVRIEHFTADGQRKLEAISTDPNLSDYQKQVAYQQFADRVVTRQTTGSFVDPTMGNLVSEGTADAISQRDYFQSLKLSDLRVLGMTITDSTTLAELIYAVLTSEIQKSDARKEI